MDAIDAIYGRRAIRRYTGQVPPREEIESLIEAAAQAPSGMNLQPWAFVVVEGRATLVDHSARAKAHLVRGMPGGSPFVAHRDALLDPEFNIFHEAAVLVVICSTEPDAMSIKDCCLAAQNLMLAAHDRHLGTCWIGFAEAWLNSRDGKPGLGIPDSYTAVAPIVLGYPAEQPVRPHRKVPDVRWIVEHAPLHA
ncbi:MAG: nitroreductase family protein [Mycobacteriales bacterium]